MLLLLQSWIELKPITLYEFLYLVLVFLTLFATVIGFIVLIKNFQTAAKHTQILIEQTKLLTKSFEANISQVDDNLMFNIDQIFIDFPQLRKFFYDGKKIKTNDPEYEKVVSISFYLIDFFAMILIQETEHGSFPLLNSYKAWMADVFRKSPIICHVLKEREKWYEDGLLKFMNESLQENKQISNKLVSES